MNGRGACPAPADTDWPLATDALPLLIAGPHHPFKSCERGFTCFGANDKFGALDCGVQIGRVDLEGVRPPAERLECSTGQVEKGGLLLVRGDIGEIHRGVLVDTQHGLVDEHHRRAAERPRPNRVMRA